MNDPIYQQHLMRVRIEALGAEIAQLKAELEHSFKSRDAGIIQIANLKDELEWARKQIAKADAERDALLKDGERYRWLRQQHWDSSPLVVVSQPKVSTLLGSYCPSDELLDAAIDSALASKQDAKP